MTSSVDVQELAFVVTGKHQKPTILNPDVLQCLGVLPTDWELARPPVYTHQVSQLIFQNGITITAQADRIMFVETISGKARHEVEVARIARKYIETLPHAEYQAVGINLRGFVPFNQSTDAAHQYLTTTLLTPGAWQTFGQAPVKASLNVVYTLDRARLYLSVNEAALQLPEGETLPIILFAGNFEYAITSDASSSMTLMQAIENWQHDLDTYQDLINRHFLAPANPFDVSATPEPVAIGI